MNFTAPRYAILFSNSQNHIVHVINHEWNRSMNVASAMSFVWDTKPVFLQYSPGRSNLYALFISMVLLGFGWSCLSGLISSCVKYFCKKKKKTFSCLFFYFRLIFVFIFLFHFIFFCSSWYLTEIKIYTNQLDQVRLVFLLTLLFLLDFVGKSGFVSHTKLTAEATFMDLFHSWLITCTMWFWEFENKIAYLGAVKFKTKD